MARKTFSILSMLLLFFAVNAQKTNVSPCGTFEQKSEWLQKYQKDKEAYAFRGGELFLPITIHNVCQDDWTAMYSETQLLKAMCTLNNDFEESRITFFLKNFNYVNDSGLFNHKDFVSGGEKMIEYSDPEGLDCYIVGNPVGNCGYFFRNAGVALNQGCIQPSDHTWAHEMGHNLSLPHPFFGWEGGIGYDNELDHNYGNPAPDTVLRDQTLWFVGDTWIDTFILHKVAVEKIDGSNCYESSDGFCDTEADYLNYRWACNNDFESYVEQTDPAGGKFVSDASLIMSYSLDACSSRFSQEQMDAMRSNAADQQAELVQYSSPSAPIDDEEVASMELMDPIDEGFDFRDVNFRWQAINNADFYLVQIGIDPNFGLVLEDTIVNNNSAEFYSLPTSFGDLFWRVTPFTSTDFCNPTPSESKEVILTDVSSINKNILSNSRVVPNLISDELEIRIVSDKQLHSYRIFNSEGMILQSGALKADCVRLENEIAPGVYFIELTTGSNSIVKRFIKV